MLDFREDVERRSTSYFFKIFQRTSFTFSKWNANDEDGTNDYLIVITNYHYILIQHTISGQNLKIDEKIETYLFLK